MWPCVALAMSIAACGAAPPAGSATPGVGARVGDVAPALAGKSIEGHPIDLSAWRGSIVVVLFWASWCVPCQAEQPALNTLARAEMAAGVHFAGVSVDVTASAAQGYIARFGVPYETLLDSGDSIVVRFDVVGPPTAFVIGRNGRVTAELVGQVNADELRGAIRTAQSTT
jgi:peroxiredoxin